MRKLILFICFITVFASCNTTKRYYFYSKMDGAADVQKNEKGSLVIDRDSIDLVYSFFGENISMEVSVNNKTPFPLYIDWDKSWLRVNDKPTRPYNSLVSYVDYASVTEQMPHTQNTYNLLTSARFDFKQISRKNLQKQKLYISDKKINTKTMQFEEDASPLVLTSCILVNINGKDIPFENKFYLSSLTNGNKKAYHAFMNDMANRDDGFCINYSVDKKEAKIANGIFGGLLHLADFIITSKLEELGEE